MLEISWERVFLDRKWADRAVEKNVATREQVEIEYSIIVRDFQMGYRIDKEIDIVLNIVQHYLF